MDFKVVIDSVSAVATSVIAITAVWALVYAHKQLKQARESEKVKHLIEFNTEFDCNPMAQWRKSVAEPRLKGVAFPDEALRLLDFFDTIGLLVRRGYLDEDDVWSTFGYWIFNIHSDFRDEIEQMQRSDENAYSDSCDLLERLRKIEHDAGSSDDRPSKEEIQEFWRDEAKTIAGAPLTKRKRRKTEPEADKK
jgi:hypothetical protein